MKIESHSKAPTVVIPPLGDDGVPVLALRGAAAARACGLSERYWWTLTKSGLVPSVRLGKAIVHPVDQLRAWLADRASETKEANT